MAIYKIAHGYKNFSKNNKMVQVGLEGTLKNI